MLKNGKLNLESIIERRDCGKVLKKERNFVSDILTFIFDMERAFLQPASQKNQDIYKVSLILQDLGYMHSFCTMVSCSTLHINAKSTL